VYMSMIMCGPARYEGGRGRNARGGTAYWLGNLRTCGEAVNKFGKLF